MTAVGLLMDGVWLEMRRAVVRHDRKYLFDRGTPSKRVRVGPLGLDKATLVRVGRRCLPGQGWDLPDETDWLLERLRKGPAQKDKRALHTTGSCCRSILFSGIFERLVPS